MIHSPHFTHIEADTPEQTQAREAAANAEWRKRLLMSHTTPLPILRKLNDLGIEPLPTVREPTPEPTSSGLHIGPLPRIAQTGLPPKVNVEGSNEQSSTVREPTPEPTPSGLHIGPLPRIAQTGLPPKVGGEQEPSPVDQEPIWRYVHGTPDFRRPEPEPQPIVLPPRNENTKELNWRYVHGTPAPPPKRPPPPKPEPLPTRDEKGERREIIIHGTPAPPPKDLNEVKFGIGRIPTRNERDKQENLVQDVLSVLNRTPIVTSPGVRFEPQPIVLPPRNENTTIPTPEPTPPGLRVEPQPIVRPIENPPRSEPGSIPPWLRIEPLPTVEPPVYITPPNINPPTPKPTPEPNPPGLRTEPLPTMPTPVFSASSVSPSGSPMGPPPMLPMTMPFGGGNNQEIGGMAADMIYL